MPRRSARSESVAVRRGSDGAATPRRYRTSRWSTIPAVRTGPRVRLSVRLRARRSSFGARPSRSCSSRSRCDAERVIAWVLLRDGRSPRSCIRRVVWLAHFRFMPARRRRAPRSSFMSSAAIGFVGYKHRERRRPTRLSSLQQAAPERAAELEQNSEFFREIKLKERVDEPRRRDPGAARRGRSPPRRSSRRRRRGVAFARRAHPHDLLRAVRDPRSSTAALSLIDDDAAAAPGRVRDRATARGRGLVLRAVKLWEARRRGVAGVRDRARGRRPGRGRARGVGRAVELPARSRACSSARCRSSCSRARTTLDDGRGRRGSLRRDPGRGDWWSIAGSNGAPSTWARSLIVLAAFGGLELYGLNGALLFMLGAVLAVAIISEIGPEEVAEVLAPTRRSRAGSPRAAPDVPDAVRRRG